MGPLISRGSFSRSGVLMDGEDLASLTTEELVARLLAIIDLLVDRAFRGR